jgi:hypothetical protein
MGTVHRVDMEDMSNCHGRSSSKPTVPKCMLKHFKKRFSGDYRITTFPRRLHILCELKWPPEDILDLSTVRAIYQVIIGMSRHSNQFPYNYLLLASGGSDHTSLGRILCQQKGTE